MDQQPESLSESECWTLLRRNVVGRVAFELDGQVLLRPVNYAVDHGTILVRTAPGSALSRCVDRAVTFEVDCGDEGARAAEAVAWSVIAEGTGRAVQGADALMETFGVPLFPWHPSAKPVFVRIEPSVVAGRRFPIADPSYWATRELGLRPSTPE